MSKELTLLRKHFESHCEVRIAGTIEERQFPHWKRLVFENALNSEELAAISVYIISYFSQKGKYSHLLPELVVYDGQLCLTFDAKEITKFLDK